MRCAEVRENLVAYLDGELTPAEEERIESHLAGCPTCRRERAGFESTGDLLGLLVSDETPTEDLAGKVLQTARDGAPWCRHIRRELVAFVDGELSEAEARPVVEHLAECEECEGERDGLVATANALAAWPLPDFDVDLAARLPVRRRRPLGRILRIGAVLTTAAAAVLVAAGLGLFTRHHGETKQEVIHEIRQLEEDLDWLEGFSEVELAVLNGREGS